MWGTPTSYVQIATKTPVWSLYKLPRFNNQIFRLFTYFTSPFTSVFIHLLTLLYPFPIQESSPPFSHATGKSSGSHAIFPVFPRFNLVHPTYSLSVTHFHKMSLNLKVGDLRYLHPCLNSALLVILILRYLNGISTDRKPPSSSPFCMMPLLCRSLSSRRSPSSNGEGVFSFFSSTSWLGPCINGKS